MRITVVGWSALLLDCAGPDEAQSWAALLAGNPLVAGAELVPGAQSLLVDGVTDPAGLARRLAALPTPAPLPADAGELVELRVDYDGPDLATVARHWGVAEDQVGPVHAAISYRVAFVGFAPGFGYLTGLPERLHVPRLATPRPRVPAGSVALAGGYTGVYPGASPGGWQLIGRTDAVLFDVAADPPALLRPGVRVRFVP